MYEEDIVNKCRICLKLKKELEMHYFFDAYFNELSLATIFKNITSFEVLKNDEFPKKICTQCKTNIVSFKNMLMVFQETELFLKENLCNIKIQDGNENLYPDEEKELLRNVDKMSDLDDNDFYMSMNFNIKYKSIADENKKIPLCNRNDADCVKCSDLKDVSLQKQENNDLCIEKKNLIRYTNKVENSGNLDYKYVSSFKYTCECGDCFLYKSGFRQHMQFRHGVLLEEGDFEKYSDEINLKVPIGFPINVEFVSSKVSTRKKNLQCRICDTKFLTEDEVKIHEEIHKTYVCDHCGAAFLKKNYLADHLRIHSEERRYTCKICEKSFKHRFTYGVHKRSHDITRNFICETCGACFKTKGTMRTHIIIKHSNVRNYPCPNCNLRFNLKSTLDKHFVRKHTPDRKKSFVCSKCGASYFNKTTLTRHVAEKHLGMAKYFPCTICENKMYVMKKGLRAHMLKKHGIVYQ